MPSHAINFAGGLEGPQTDVGLDVGLRHAPWGGMPCTKRALIDTGATATVVSPAVRAALNPMKIGSARVQVPGGRVVWNDTYFVRLKFGSHIGPGRWFVLEVVEYQPSTPNVDVLIGMDLLVRIKMTWDGPRGLLVLTF
jgi:predicted aspartyl protease